MAVFNESLLFLNDAKNLFKITNPHGNGQAEVHDIETLGLETCSLSFSIDVIEGGCPC